MALTSRTADRFEAALSDEGVAGAVSDDLAPLVTVARRSAEVGSHLPGPDAEFVAALGRRLREEAERRPARLLPADPPRGSAEGPQRRTLVLVIGAGLPRRVVGAVASLAIVATLVGVASRSALPGSPLYPVKGWLDAIAVQVSGSQHDRGMTELAQAQEHISDARDLLAEDPVAGEHVAKAFTDAASSLRAARRDLQEDYAKSHQPRSLLALSDFAQRVRPQLSAMRPDVPPSAMPAYTDLLQLLDLVEASTRQLLATCGAPCGPAPLGQSGATATYRGPGASVPAGGGPAVSSTSGLPGASGTVGGDGASVGVGGGGVSLGTGGASVGVPLGSSSSASLTVPLSPLTTLLPSDPVTSATTLLPSASLSLGDHK